jgi:hypothetical protein
VVRLLEGLDGFLDVLRYNEAVEMGWGDIGELVE